MILIVANESIISRSRAIADRYDGGVQQPFSRIARLTPNIQQSRRGLDQCSVHHSEPSPRSLPFTELPPICRVPLSSAFRTLCFLDFAL